MSFGDESPCSVATPVTAVAKPSTTIRLRRGANGMDVFFAVNLALFVLMCAFAYYDRWVKYAGDSRPAVLEFFSYAVILIMVIAALWAWLRRYALPGWLLLLIEVGILAHFAGGLVHFGGARLYDHHYLGIRYDKYVHLANAFIMAFAVQEICRLKGQPMTGFTRGLVFLTVLGLGGLFEIYEYAVTLSIPRNGVGDYVNTMGDLLANVCGGALFLVFRGRFPLGRS